TPSNPAGSRADSAAASRPEVGALTAARARSRAAVAAPEAEQQHREADREQHHDTRDQQPQREAGFLGLLGGPAVGALTGLAPAGGGEGEGAGAADHVTVGGGDPEGDGVLTGRAEFARGHADRTAVDRRLAVRPQIAV